MENENLDRRIISKILKLDKNNQYGYAMKKQLRKGCIKQQKHIPSQKEFNMFLKTVDLDIKIGYLFVVDIDFNLEQSNAKTLK